MLSVEKPGSPAEVLEHAGVKGMKWGVRKAANVSVQSHYSRRSGRTNSKKIEKSFKKQNPTSGHKADTIRLARSTSNVKFQQATLRKGGTKAERRAARVKFLNDPDRAVALRTTRGEKVVGGLLAVSGVGTLPIIALATGMRLQRRHIERKQARGGYR